MAGTILIGQKNPMREKNKKFLTTKVKRERTMAEGGAGGGNRRRGRREGEGEVAGPKTGEKERKKRGVLYPE